MDSINFKIIHIHIGSADSGGGGGEKCFFELVKEYDRLGFKQEIYVGFKSSISEFRNLSKNAYVHYMIDKNLQIKNKILYLWLYFKTFFISFKYIKKYNENILIITHSEVFSSVVFARLLKWKNKKAFWIAIIHMLVPPKNFDLTPSIMRYYHILEQNIFFKIQKKSNLLVTVNEMYDAKLMKYNINRLNIKYGKEKEFFYINPFEKRTIDIIFIGRFYPQKGIDQIPDICRCIDDKLKSNGIDIKLNFGLIGVMNEEGERLKKNLNAFLSRFNFIFYGFKSGDEKYDLLGKSKVFVFPSHFESFGIVYLDAISVGTPVIEYDIPCFNDHRKGIIKVPYLNNEVFAEKIIKLLFNKELFNKLSIEGFDYSSEFSWKKTSNLILEKINI